MRSPARLNLICWKCSASWSRLTKKSTFQSRPPDPIQAIEFHLDRLGLSRRDLEPYLGSRARVSEVLNRKRPLTLAMIRRLQAGLGIPGEVLLQHYPLASEAATPPTRYNRIDQPLPPGL